MAQQKRAANELAAEQRQKTRHQVQIPAGPIEIRNLSLVEGPPPSLAKNTEVDLENRTSYACLAVGLYARHTPAGGNRSLLSRPWCQPRFHVVKACTRIAAPRVAQRHNIPSGARSADEMAYTG